jgi:hypothetical protein
MGLRQPNPMTRFLLGLWSFGGVGVAVKQGDLMKVADYGSIMIKKILRGLP